LDQDLIDIATHLVAVNPLVLVVGASLFKKA